jgi:DNA-directed RNA polymerase subunit RPC12/RpoP
MSQMICMKCGVQSEDAKPSRCSKCGGKEFYESKGSAFGKKQNSSVSVKTS